MQDLKMKDQMTGHENAGPQETWPEIGGQAAESEYRM